jgi:SART-1 family
VISDLTEFVETLSSVPLLKQNEIDKAIDKSLSDKPREIVPDIVPEDNEDNEDHEDEVDMDLDIDDQHEQIDDEESDSQDDTLNPGPNKGLAGTLSLLSSKGYLEPSKGSITKFTKSQQEILIDLKIKQEFIKFGNDREWPKRLKELEREREKVRVKRLEDYKPVVELLHRDKAGRELTPKEVCRIFILGV